MASPHPIHLDTDLPADAPPWRTQLHKDTLVVFAGVSGALIGNHGIMVRASQRKYHCEPKSKSKSPTCLVNPNPTFVILWTHAMKHPWPKYNVHMYSHSAPLIPGMQGENVLYDEFVRVPLIVRHPCPFVCPYAPLTPCCLP